MFMEITFTDNTGDTESINVLRGNIQTELNQGNRVLVKFLQPGVMYEKDDVWHTVIDFMNEWQGRPVRFQSNLVPLKKCEAEFEYTNDMFFTGPRLYQENKMCVGLLTKLIGVAEKDTTMYWDLLLGEVSENKDWLHNAITTHPVLDKTFLTYFGRDTKKGHWSRHVVRPKKHTAETLGDLANRFNTQIRCSDLIDPEIYNQTHYTAMIETTIHNDFAMFSEKEAKPIVAQRPFIIFGAWRQLEAFRSLGFKTFFEVIDESYDLIEDKEERWRRALDSMLALSQKDPIEVYHKLREVLAHNKNHFENHAWERCLSWDSYQ
jgi:hypothetical protein